MAKTTAMGSTWPMTAPAGILLVLGLLAWTEPAEVWAQVTPTPPTSSARPILVSVDVTRNGYVLTGSGFGTNASIVRVFEGTLQVPATAIAVVQDDRIVVLRRLWGTIQHRVVVGGVPSGIRVVTHPASTTACMAGFAGPACQYSEATTCNRHGTVDNAGACKCSANFFGPACQTSATTCAPHGTVAASGACRCNTGFTGPTCNQCAANFYGYPACRFCLSATTCKGNGFCSTSGLCKCAQGFTGADCATPVPLRLSLGTVPLWPFPLARYWAVGRGSAGAPYRPRDK